MIIQVNPAFYIVDTEAERSTAWANNCIVFCKDTEKTYFLTDGIFMQSRSMSAIIGTLPFAGDTTTGNVSTSMHGFVPKATGSTSNFLRADGTWASPGASSTDIKQTEVGRKNKQ